MANITPSSGSIVKPFRSPWGAFPQRAFGVSTGISSAVIYRGAQVTLDKGSTNQYYVKRSTATGAPDIVGYAAQETPSTSPAGTIINVHEANPNVEFSAITKNGLIDSTSVGEYKAIVYDSTLNIHYIDLGNSSVGDARVIVTQLIDSPGDSGGRVAFRHVTNVAPASSVVSTVNLLAFYR